MVVTPLAPHGRPDLAEKRITLLEADVERTAAREYKDKKGRYSLVACVSHASLYQASAFARKCAKAGCGRRCSARGRNRSPTSSSRAGMAIR